MNRSRTSVPAWCACTILALLWAGAAALKADDAAPDRKPAPLRFIGYLPDYRLAELSDDATAPLTDVMLFSASYTAEGTLQTPLLESPRLAKLREQWNGRGSPLRVHLTVGGWERSAGFLVVTRTPERRAAAVVELVALCRKHQLAGLDLDWEHPHGADEEQQYADFIQELAAALHRDGRELSAAVAPWQRLPAAGWAALDGVSLMSYDHPGRHATLEQSQADVARLIAQQIPPRKIRLGIPLYGRSVTDANHAVPYAELLARHHPQPHVDEAAGIYFNGRKTALAKFDLIRTQQLGGAMFWEIGQDAQGDYGLMRAIQRASAR